MQKGIEDFPGLIAQLECLFSELSSDLTIAMRDSDEEYAAMSKRLTALSMKHRFIEPALEGGGALSLSEEEHAGLVEYLNLRDELDRRERLNLYYAGHRDCFAYLHKIGVV